MAATNHSALFRRTLTSIERGEILIPPLRAYLYDPDFRAFDVEIRNLGNRPPDGWFHPSEHPGYADRVLYLYLTSPDLLHYEPWDPMTNISAAVGSTFHAIVQHILKEELGLLKDVEIRLKCDETGARGSMDGMLADEGFEFKTMSPRMFGKIKNAEDFLERYPHYAFQAQEYMRMSGLARMRVLCMVISFPFEMVEFTIDYDPSIALATRDKYLRVRQAVADQRIPKCCGEIKSCPARHFCSMPPKIGAPA